jgi:predicted dehydrogenase
MRIAFIGGNGHHVIGHTFKHPYQGTANSQVAAASDGVAPDAAKAYASRLPAHEWFDDYRKMLDTFKPEVVSVGAVYVHNGPIIQECLKRNIPTVSDKPIASSWADYEALKQLLAENPDRKIITEFTFRSRQEFRAARQAVKDNRIGKVVLATGQKSYRFGARPQWYQDRKDYCGTLMWVASHAIDAVHFVTGDPYASFIGTQGNIAKPDYGTMEDHTVTMFKLASGASGVIHADLLRPAAASSHGDDRLRIVGTQGQIEVRDNKCKLITATTGEEDITGSVSTKSNHFEILDAIFKNDPALYSTAESLNLARLLLLARDATDTGKWINV